MDQEGEQRAKRDDTCHDQDLFEFPNGNGTQNLTAELELESHRHALCQIETDIRVVFHLVINPMQTGDDDNNHADIFKQQDRIIDNFIQNRV